MRSSLSIALVALGGLLMLACGGSDSGENRGGGGMGGTGITLDCSALDPRPADCDKDCTSSAQCEASFCDNGKCVAHCTATQGCGANATCNVSGRCVPNTNTGGTGGTGGGNSCQSVTITPTRSTPNVMFLVDQSGSMPWCLQADRTWPPDDCAISRWEAAHVAIMGIVSQLHTIVSFGLTTYQSADGGSTPDQCPIFDTQVDFAENNFNAINMSYEADFPGGEDTPTGDSIDVLVDSIKADPPDPTGPTIIVLATDGAPDSCEYPNPSNSAEHDSARGEAVNAAGAAHDDGIDVFVLWVGTLSSDPIRNHLQEVANEGVGKEAGESMNPARFWTGATSEELATAFGEIVGASISCDIQMDKEFLDKEQACNDPNSNVRLNDRRLDCDSEWRVKPAADDIIELVGSACTEFKSGASTFSATFPCGAIIVE